jgi:hypothetical protein
MLKTQKYCMRKIKIHIIFNPEKRGKEELRAKKQGKHK